LRPFTLASFTALALASTAQLSDRHCFVELADRAEACDYMTAMDKQRERRQRWQRVAKLILAKENVLTVTRALELALFMDAKLDVAKVSAK
jgi:hypothetical protein